MHRIKASIVAAAKAAGWIAIGALAMAAALAVHLAICWQLGVS